MNQELLKDLDKSFETFFDNFKHNNGSEALKISLGCIESNYLSLQEDDETNEEELKIIEKHLSDLEYFRRSGDYLSYPNNLKPLQAQMSLFDDDFECELENINKDKIVQVSSEWRLVQMVKKSYFRGYSYDFNYDIPLINSQNKAFALLDFAYFSISFGHKNVYISKIGNDFCFDKVFLRIDNTKKISPLITSLFNDCKARISLQYSKSFRFLCFDFDIETEEIEENQCGVRRSN